MKIPQSEYTAGTAPIPEDLLLPMRGIRAPLPPAFEALMHAG